LGAIGKLDRKDVWGTLESPPQKNVFQAMRNTKKYITSAKNVNGLIGENSISYF